MEQKYEELLENLTETLNALNGNICALHCEIYHLRDVIAKAEAKAKAKTDYIGKQKIEKRLRHGRKSV